MLAKKEYELIADVIRDLPEHPGKRAIVNRFAKRFEFNSPKFNKGKFTKACYAKKAETES